MPRSNASDESCARCGQAISSQNRHTMQLGGLQEVFYCDECYGQASEIERYSLGSEAADYIRQEPTRKDLSVSYIGPKGDPALRNAIRFSAARASACIETGSPSAAARANSPAP